MTLEILSMLCVLLLSKVAANSRLRCDPNEHQFGADCDGMRSLCNDTANQCQCIADHTIRVGTLCLKRVNVTQPCFTTQQCLNNSKCFLNNTELVLNVKIKASDGERNDALSTRQGICVCNDNYYFGDSNNECRRRKPIGRACARDHECQRFSVCDAKTRLCSCKHTDVYSSAAKRCVVGKYLGQRCVGREECQFSEQFSWCIDGVCLCASGYTPEPNYDGVSQCVLLVEKVELSAIGRQTQSNQTDYVTPLAIIAFVSLLVFTIFAIFAFRKKRNPIMRCLCRSSNAIRDDCLQSHVVMIPIDNNTDTNENNFSDNSKLNP